MDVEGYEFNVLEGFGEILKHVHLFFIEINGLSDASKQAGLWLLSVKQCTCPHWHVWFHRTVHHGIWLVQRPLTVLFV